MSFTFLDVILVIFFFAFVFGGFALGLIRAIGALVGLVLGTWSASHYFMPLSDWLSPFIGGRVPLANIIAFLLIFIIVDRLTVLVFHFINKAFRVISVVPFLKTFNRIGGVILGAVEGLLTLGIIIYVIAKFAPAATFVTGSLDNSRVAHWLVNSASWLVKLLPQAFANIRSIF